MAAQGRSSSTGFAVTLDCTDEGTVVRLRGAATMEHADSLRDQLLAIAPTLNGRLVLDLSQLEFINSVGLGAFVSAHLRCQRLGGEVKLVAPPPPIRQLLELTQLTKLFGVYASLEEARRGGIVPPPS